MDIITESVLTCPFCGYRETMKMPTDSCLYYHQCRQCGKLLKPKHGDCCVFCSYGSRGCPPVQLSEVDDTGD